MTNKTVTPKREGTVWPCDPAAPVPRATLEVQTLKAELASCWKVPAGVTPDGELVMVDIRQRHQALEEIEVYALALQEKINSLGNARELTVACFHIDHAMTKVTDCYPGHFSCGTCEGPLNSAGHCEHCEGEGA